MRKNVERQVARSQHREQQIGGYKELGELEERREISRRAKAGQAANAAWSETLDRVKPMEVSEEAPKPATETVPLTEQPQALGLDKRWYDGIARLAAAVTMAAAIGAPAQGLADDVRVGPGSHIQATTNVAKDFAGKVKRGGKEYSSPEPDKQARATLQPGDTLHPSGPQTIDDQGLRIVNQTDYCGTWTLGSPGDPAARLMLNPTNRGTVEGLLLQRTNQENTYIAYRISDCQLDTNDGVLKGGWSLSLRNARIKTTDSLGTQHELWKGTPKDGTSGSSTSEHHEIDPYTGSWRTERSKQWWSSTSKYDGKNPVINPDGGAQFMLQEDGTLLYSFRMDTPSGKFKRPLRVIGPWTRAAEKTPQNLTSTYITSQ